MEPKDTSNQTHRSKTIRNILIAICIAIVALVIFEAGMIIGFKKAEFAERFAENYYRNFGGPRGGLAGNLPDDNIAGGHGASGKILRVNLPTLVIADNDGSEKVVILNNDTMIRQFHNEASSTDLKPDEFALVIGSPNEQGQIAAKFIRIVPGPSPVATTTQTQ